MNHLDYTPGDWFVTPMSTNILFVYSQEHRLSPLATIVHHDPLVAQANARLISNAPRLYVALQNLMTPFGEHIGKHAPGLLEQAREAIDRVQGVA